MDWHLFYFRVIFRVYSPSSLHKYRVVKNKFYFRQRTFFFIVYNKAKTCTLECERFDSNLQS